MITPDLIKYIREQTAAGVSKDTIASTLVQHGWSARDISDAFANIAMARNSATIASPNATSAHAAVTQLPSHLGRKLTLSFGFIVFSLIYGFSRYSASPVLPADTSVVATADTSTSGTSIDTSATATTPTPTTPTQTTTNSSSFTPVPVKVPVSTPTPTPVQTPVPVKTPVVVPTPAPVTKPKGQYTDGSYTGSAADAYYGTIQVKAVITNGALSDVVFLQYPNDRSNSVRINTYAMPNLKQEAIAAQSANINGVSGATYSSQAFVQSLSSALSQAKA